MRQLLAALCLLIVGQIADAAVFMGKGAGGVPPSPLPLITASFAFTHPGTLNTASQLTTIKNHISAGQQPWAANYALMTASSYCQLTYTPHPIAVVNDNVSSTYGIDLEEDSEAAYCLALRYVFTGTQSYATKAESIIAAWDSTLTGFIGLNWYLNTAWSAQTWAEAGDILNYYDSTWTGQAALKQMFNNIYLPILHKRISFGNREFAVEAGMISIAVFMEDPAALYEAIQNNLSYVPTYVYIPALDGATPGLPTYFNTWASDTFLESLNSTRLCSGCTNWITLALTNNHGGYAPGCGDDCSMVTFTVAQYWANPIGSLYNLNAVVYPPGWSPEIGGRDMGHAESAMDQATIVDEIAWNQGLDVYSQVVYRLVAYTEQLAALRLGGAIPAGTYPPPPTSTCAGEVSNICPGAGTIPSYEILANHAINILGYSMPNTSSYITEVIRNMTNSQFVSPFSSPFPTSPALFTVKIFNQAYYQDNYVSLTHARLNGSSP